MYDWLTFWNNYPDRVSETELLKQVGKTVGGSAISQEQFLLIIDGIKSILELNKKDRVLDLCCGNGIISRELAKECEFVVGADFSKPLIQIAKKFNNHNNIEYILMDIRHLGELTSLYKNYFTKVLCYEALAFFDKKEFEHLLKDITDLCSTNPVILFGSVLDRSRRWHFFNTLRRKVMYFINIKLLGREVGLGRWWESNEIVNICRKNHLIVEIIHQNKELHTAHYRFDVKITKKHDKTTI